MSANTNHNTTYFHLLDDEMTATASVQFISNDMSWYAMKILMFGVTPTISLFGVIGNIFSLHILTKHGLHKCSNILLVSLAFSDIMFLISFNSVPKILYEAVWNHEYRELTELEAQVLFVLFSLFTLLDYTFCSNVLTLPMLVTLERLVVIFLPLTFKRVITPVRTWIAVLGVTSFFLALFTYTSFWTQVNHANHTSDNHANHTSDNHTSTSVWYIQKSSFFYNNLQSVSVVELIFTYSSTTVPPIITALGCIVISVQIKISSYRRRQMTSKAVSGTRTTKMLLSVCCVYLVTAAILSVPHYIPQYGSYSLTEETPSNLGKVLYQLVNTAVCVNSSSNFIVYIVLNKNFRKTFLQLFRRR